MAALCLSPLNGKLCVAWTAEVPINVGFPSDVSDRFEFMNKQYRLRVDYLDIYRLKLVLVEGNDEVDLPFVTVLVLKREIEGTVCRTLACQRVPELPWDCPLQGQDLTHYASVSLAEGTYYNKISFIFIFEEDPNPPPVQEDVAEEPVEMESASETPEGWNFPPNLENLSLDFANLLKNGMTLLPPDVRLKCGGHDRAIPAHRTVLAARSEVFAAMFRNEMAERQSGDVDVVDVEEDVIDIFLEYVYSGKIESIVSDEVVPRLYEAGDKYAVHALRDACRERMASCLSEENCVGLLTLADAHSDAIFKKSVIDYICSNESVLKGEAWREFTKKPSYLAMEVFKKKLALEM